MVAYLWICWICSLLGFLVEISFSLLLFVDFFGPFLGFFFFSQEIHGLRFGSYDLMSIDLFNQYWVRR